MTEIRAELAKLARPALVVACLACAGFVAVLTSFDLANADVQYEVAISNYERIVHPPSETTFCSSMRAQVGPECDRARMQELAAARDLFRETSEAYPLARAAQDPLGVGGVVAGLLASIFGALVLGGLTAAHVAGEWTGGTIKSVLASDPRRTRFLVGKFLTSWLAGIGLLAFAWAGMIALGPFFRRLYDAPPAPAGFDLASYAGEQVLRSILVLAAIAALATAAGVLLRTPLTAFGLVLAVLFVSLAGTAWSSTFRLSPAYWLATWMRFRPGTRWVDHVWVDRFPSVGAGSSLHASQAAGLTGLVATICVALVVAGVRLSRSDVGG